MLESALYNCYYMPQDIVSKCCVVNFARALYFLSEETISACVDSDQLMLIKHLIFSVGVVFQF